MCELGRTRTRREMAIGVGHDKGGTRRGRRRSPMSEINVTPLVDVMLVLLIVFMVTAPLLTTGVPVDLPASSAGAIAVEDKGPVEITLKRDGAIFVGDMAVPRADLVPKLQAILSTAPDRRIYLRADAGLSYGEVMALMGALNDAGFAKLALVSAPAAGG